MLFPSPCLRWLLAASTSLTGCGLLLSPASTAIRAHEGGPDVPLSDVLVVDTQPDVDDDGVVMRDAPHLADVANVHDVLDVADARDVADGTNERDATDVPTVLCPSRVSARVRQIAPASGSVVTDHVRLEWASPPTTGVLRVVLRPLYGSGGEMSFDARGTQFEAPPRTLTRGAYRWFVRNTVPGCEPVDSFAWEFHVRPRHSLRSSESATRAALGTVPDFDKDGRGDLLVAFDGGMSIAAFFSGPTLFSRTPSMIPISGDPTGSDGLVFPRNAGDTDGDGRVEAVLSTSMAGTVRYQLLRDGPSEMLSSPVSIGMTRVTPFGVGDFDRDGDAELLLRPSSILQLRNGEPRTGSADVATRELTGVPLDRSRLSFASTGDINGDGFSDVVVGIPTTLIAMPGQLFWLQGASGTARVEALELLRTATDRLPSFGDMVAGAGDINGDGIGDVAVVELRSSRAPLIRFFSYRDGIAFEPVSSLETTETLLGNGARITSMTAVGDVNGDGFDDFAWHRFESGFVRVALGGAATSADAPMALQIRPSSTSEANVAIVGLGDADGAPDARGVLCDDFAVIGTGFVRVFRGSRDIRTAMQPPPIMGRFRAEAATYLERRDLGL